MQPTRYWRPKTGATLIESVVAVVIFGLLMTSLLPLVVGTALVRRQQADISEATALAQTQLEDIRRFWGVTKFTPRSNAGGLLGYKVTPNYDQRSFPLFGETTSGCLPKTITLDQTKEITNGVDKTVYGAAATLLRYTTPSYATPDAFGLDDNYAVQPTDAKVYSYGLVANPQITLNLGKINSTQCSYLNSPSDSLDKQNVNNGKTVRFIAQIYYGPSPGAQLADIDGNGQFNSAADITDPGIMPNGENIYNSFRVVVRIYPAQSNPSNSSWADNCRGQIKASNLSGCLSASVSTNTLNRAVSTGDAAKVDRSAPLVVTYTDVPRTAQQ